MTIILKKYYVSDLWSLSHRSELYLATSSYIYDGEKLQLRNELWVFDRFGVFFAVHWAKILLPVTLKPMHFKKDFFSWNFVLEKYLQASTRFSRFPKIFKHSNLKIETEDFESHELVLVITIHRILNKIKRRNKIVVFKIFVSRSVLSGIKIRAD